MTAKNTHQGRRRRVAPAYLKRKGSIGKDGQREALGGALVDVLPGLPLDVLQPLLPALPDRELGHGLLAHAVVLGHRLVASLGTQAGVVGGCCAATIAPLRRPSRVDHHSRKTANWRPGSLRTPLPRPTRAR